MFFPDQGTPCFIPSHQPTDQSCSKGGGKYHSTFYVYEELASAPSTTTPSSLVGQAIADIHLHRFPEAEATLQQALDLDPTDPQALANKIVLACLMGTKPAEVEGLVASLKGVDERHLLVRDLEDKERLFDEAGARFRARVEVS